METKENLNKGITLVALVITIIILLILAGVAITLLASPEDRIELISPQGQENEPVMR